MQRKLDAKHYLLRGMSLVEHETAVQQKLTERYLLGEMDSATRDEFEEHYFACPECAFDIQAGAAFVEQSKAILGGVAPELVKVRPPDPSPGWFRWLRPVFAAPALALLLAVVTYQNVVTLPRLRQTMNQPQVLPWVSVNIRTLGTVGRPAVVVPGQGLLMFVRIPPDAAYARYTAELYGPDGKLEASLSIPASAAQDEWAVRLPGAERQSGTYTLAVRGETSGGESKDVGRGSFELQVQ